MAPSLETLQIVSLSCCPAGGRAGPVLPVQDGHLHALPTTVMVSASGVRLPRVGAACQVTLRKSSEVIRSL